MEKSGFYLPEFELTPQAIFQNEILAFDVNFFNPKSDKITKNPEKKEIVDENPNGGEWREGEYYTIEDLFSSVLSNKGVTINKDKIEDVNTTGEQCIYNGYDNFNHKESDCPYDGEKFLVGDGKGDLKRWHEEHHFHDNKYVTMETVSKKYQVDSETTYKIKAIIVRKYYHNKKSNKDSGFDERYDVATQVADWQLTKVTVAADEVELSSANQLQPVVSAWYVTFRNIALVALLSVLVYIGIRITLSSVASDKAKYKQMLGDWVVALCLVFLMHYIMSFAVTINDKIIQAISSITISNIGSVNNFTGNNPTEVTTPSVEERNEDVDKNTKKNDNDEEFDGTGVQLFIIEGTEAENAYKVLVGDDDAKDADGNAVNSGSKSSYRNRFSEDKKTLYWPANDFMTQARLLGQQIEVDSDGKETNASQTSVTRAGYNIIYVVLVIYTLIFCFTYLKRVIYMAFLTIIAPLVAITYPIDKVNDGKAQAFDMWLKEYIFNLLIQPMHLILYTILVGSAMKFAAQNIFYVVVALGFLMPAEKLLRRFFGFEKAQTPGMFAGPAASALMMTGLRKLMPPKSPKGGPGPGGSNSKDGENEETKTPPWRDKEFDATDNLIGIGGNNTQNNQNNTNDSEFRDNLTEEEQQKLNFAQTGRQEALDAMNTARTEDERREYQDLFNSYENDLNRYRNPNFTRMNNPNNTNIGTNKNISPASSKPKKKISRRKAIKHGMQSYGDLLKKRYKANKAQKGGFIKRGIRMAGGVAAAGTLAAAGGIIGITSGDPSKAAQYMAAGVAGGYSLGTKAVDGADNSRKRAKESIDTFKEGYYGDEYSKKQQEKYKKDFIKNDENVKKIAKKLNVERSEAREIMKNDMGYYIDKEIYNIDDMIATYKLEQEIGRDQAVATAQYATQVMNGEDTRYMTSKKKNEYRNTFIPKFTQKGSRNPEADVDKVFDNVDKFHKFKK